MVKNHLLTEKQKTVLKLHSQGKTISEITEKTGYSRNTVYYALKTGQKRLDRTIETVGLAIRNKLLNKKQVVELKEILRRIELSR